jgi:ABC-type transport system involved in multi-copper enzyme maturation permease subunit
MIDQLMWKDYKNQRPVILVGLLLLFGPYVVSIGMNGLPFGFSGTNVDAMKAFLAFSIISCAISQITILLVGATVIGSEKQDGGLEFLLTLPPKRSRIIAAKVLYSGLVFVSVWAISLLTQYFCLRELRQGTYLEIRSFGFGAAATGVLFFGVAWLVSIVTRGVAIPVCSSLVVAALLVLLVNQFGIYRGWHIDDFHVHYCQTLFTLFSLIGTTCFVIGCGLFTRRYEP